MLKKTGGLNLLELIRIAQLVANNNEGTSIYVDYEPSRIRRIWIIVPLNCSGLRPFELPHLITDHGLNPKSMG